MRWFKLLLLAVLGGVLLQPALAQVQLQFKPPDKFFVELKSDYNRSFKSTKGEVKDRSETNQVLAITILKSNPDGSKVVEIKMDSFKVVVTDAAGKTKESSHSEWQGMAVQLTLTPDLEVARVEGLEGVLKKNDPKGTVRGAGRAYQLENLENQVRWWAAQIFVPLAPKAVQTGDKWEQKAVRTLGPYGHLRLIRTLTYQGTEAVSGQDLHKVSFTTAHSYNVLRNAEGVQFKVLKPSINKGEYTGTLYFDDKAGVVVRAEAKELRDMVLTLSTDDIDLTVRLRDEGTSSMRFFDKKP